MPLTGTHWNKYRFIADLRPADYCCRVKCLLQKLPDCFTAGWGTWSHLKNLTRRVRTCQRQLCYYWIVILTFVTVMKTSHFEVTCITFTDRVIIHQRVSAWLQVGDVIEVMHQSGGSDIWISVRRRLHSRAVNKQQWGFSGVMIFDFWPDFVCIAVTEWGLTLCTKRHVIITLLFSGSLEHSVFSPLVTACYKTAVIVLCWSSYEANQWSKAWDFISGFAWSIHGKKRVSPESGNFNVQFSNSWPTQAQPKIPHTFPTAKYRHHVRKILCQWVCVLVREVVHMLFFSPPAWNRHVRTVTWFWWDRRTWILTKRDRRKAGEAIGTLSCRRTNIGVRKKEGEK